MERTGIQVVSLTRDELIACLASIETVLDKCGPEFPEREPVHYQCLMRTRHKLHKLLRSEQDRLLARI